MSEPEKIISRAAFCEAQIAAWSKRADHLRALLARLDDACPHHKEARGVITCPCGLVVRNDNDEVTTPIDNETIEAMQRAIALCDVESEHWRARARGAASAPRGAA